LGGGLMSDSSSFFNKVKFFFSGDYVVEVYVAGSSVVLDFLDNSGKLVVSADYSSSSSYGSGVRFVDLKENDILDALNTTLFLKNFVIV
jgi:hypothetical protein